MCAGLPSGTGRGGRLHTGITLRDAAPSDAAFLRELFLDGHPEFAALPAAAAGPLVDLQITAQRQQYVTAHPAARDRIVEHAGRPVGRCWVAETPPEIRLLDLGVRSAFRGRGIGTAVLRGLCEGAAASGRPVRLAVWSANAGARRLYERLGFQAEAEAGGYVSMCWR